MENTTPSTAETAQAATETTTERFQITTMDHVQWFLRNLLAKDAQAATVQFTLDTITANCQEELRQIAADKAHFMSLYAEQVQAVVKAELETSKRKRKSITTPYGILGFREVPAGLVIEDKQAVADHAVVLGMQKISGDTVAYKAHAEEVFDKTGEVLPGFTFKPAEERFSIRNAKPKGTETETEGAE